MKKINLTLVLFLVISLIISFSIVSGAEEYVMKVGHSHSVKAPRHQSVVRFKELVEERTDGKISVEIYPSNQLGTEAEMLESVKMGTIQATLGGQFEAASPKLLIYTMPFLFKDVESAYSIIRGPVGEKIAESSKENGIIILATGDAGIRQFTNNKRPITKPGDMKGLKMRTPPIDSIIKIMESLGANPVSVPYAELYTALKTGVADGQENPFVNMVDKKLYEVQKYLTVVNYQFHPNPLYTSLDWYNKLEPELQNILKECAEEMMVYSDKLNYQQSQEALSLLESEMEVNYLTDNQREMFIEESQEVYDYYINKGYFTMEEINEIREAAE